MTHTVIYTDGGSVDKRGTWYGGWGFAGIDTHGATFCGYGACLPNATNNAAELEAFIRACEFALLNKFEKVEFVLDSKYVLKGTQDFLVTWVKNGWMTTNGTPVKNKEYWLRVLDVCERLDTANVSKVLSWVKGHSGVEGNELADKGATTGIGLSIRGVTDPVLTYITEDKAKEVKKVKAVPSRFLCGRRMPMVTGKTLTYREASEHYIYFTTNFDDTDNILSRYLGRSGSDVFEGVVLVKEKDPVVELIRDRQFMEVSLHDYVPFVLHWDKISSKKAYANLTVYGTEALTADERTINLRGQEILSNIIEKPKLCFRSYDSLDSKYDLLNQYMNGALPDHADSVINLTTDWFETDLKGKTKLKPEVASAKSMSLSVPYKGQNKKVILTPNVDMPIMTKVAQMLKEQGTLKVFLILHDRKRRTFRYSLVIEGAKGSIGLFDCPFTNICLL